MSKPTIHFIEKSLLNPTNPITVNVIGAGGTGSHMIEVLARINFVLTGTGKAGLQVNLFDDDIIESPNLGRASFNENYLGINKAVAVIDNINRKFGTNWKAIPKNYIIAKGVPIPKNRIANLTICCVDTVKARVGINELLKEIMQINGKSYQRDRPMYLMDLGNNRKTGQVILSTICSIKQPESEQYATIDSMPSMLEEYADHLSKNKDQNDVPSCSLFEALNKQSLFINSTLANHAGALIDEMLTDGALSVRGIFVNLESHRVEPIKL